MKKILEIIFCCLILISCNKSDKHPQNDKHDSPLENGAKQNSDSIQSKDQKQLSISALKNSKWIIGEVGVNGEQPDTIIFNKSDSLLYVSTDTGGEECCYFINNDTLIFINHLSSYDYEKKSDVNEKRSNKLVFSNGKLCYVETIVEVDNTRKIVDLRKNNLCFKRLH